MLARKINCLSLVALLWVALIPVWSSMAFAQGVRADRPDVYTVLRGDTLWDISGRFLTEPWLWPEIWQANPQIKNPHLIFPGDEISLVFVGGKPRLRLRRGARPVVKASPMVRVSRRGRASIPTIPIDAISQFLSRPRVVGDGFLEQSPYVVSVGKEHLVAGAGFRIYARGQGLDAANRFAIFRQGVTYRDPATDQIIGYEALHLGDAVIERHGDPATLRLIQTTREVLAGDRLLPVDEERFEQNFQPRAPATAIDGSIIEVVEGVTQIGQYQVVVLNLGVSNGIEPGHVLAVWQKGAVVIDKHQREPKSDVNDLPTPEALSETDPARQGGLDGLSIAADRLVRDVQRKIVDLVDLDQPTPVEVALPNERAGTIMVFRAYDRISYSPGHGRRAADAYRGYGQESVDRYLVA